MSKAKHTPGPWKRQHLTITATKNGAKVAEIDPPNKFFKGREREEEMAYCRANARLIAAAPELLAALQRLVPVNDIKAAPEAYAQEWHEACAAIAKAKGESP